MVERPVLVLNQSYEPLNICRARRAVVLVYSGRAELLENGSGFIHTAHQAFPLPSVIRMLYLIKRPHPQPKLTRLEVFNRDHHICQYCGRETRQLTLDHIIPRHIGGEHTWENLVSACAACNRRKAGKTPEQAGMKLLRPPVKPHRSHYYTIPYQYRKSQLQWHKYLAQ
jgi:5-methylcytosine-specific restriction endonuclease McrA